MNSNKVFKFSGEGAVISILLYPYATAPATLRPKADDFPLPLAAVTATVLLRLFSDITSTRLITVVA